MSQPQRRFFPKPPKKHVPPGSAATPTTSQNPSTNRRTRNQTKPATSTAPPTRPVTKRRASERTKAASEQPQPKQAKLTQTQAVKSKKMVNRPPPRKPSPRRRTPTPTPPATPPRHRTPTPPPPASSGSLLRDPFNQKDLDMFSFKSAAQIAQAHKYGPDDGREICSAMTPDKQFIASTTVALANCQQMTNIYNDLTRQIGEIRDLVSRQGHGVSGNAATAAPWLSKVDGQELRKSIRQSAMKAILRGDLQAYTATKNQYGDKATLPVSLYAAVMDAIMSNPIKWQKRLLPKGYGKNAKPLQVKAVKTLVNVVLKEVRKVFETELLQSIQLPGRRTTTDNGSVPSLNTIVANLYDKEIGQIGGRVPVRDEVFDQVGHLQKSRYAYLRLQACHWGFYKKDYRDGATFWSIVDEKLEFLRGQSSRFYIQCLTEDNELFQGKKTLAEIRPLTLFPIPNEIVIQEIMDNLNDTWGDTVPADEELHAMKKFPAKNDNNENDGDDDDDDAGLEEEEEAGFDEEAEEEEEAEEAEEEAEEEEEDEDAGFDDEE
ncbi:uncharacterized protein MELLADRAFT_85311 [Melampsora larici-populina 98AG31]|uniref:Uncharacterized protein n=1 Tax=Melampsora larici-populina (strain 98AG31 / pathotype 3-4-7) TaxID=747676 RepID=F4RIB5_MELLP|nr:uncharacterized protein MELLADRAFT_85311 [Melampsora larici-populina 98AG31]EGG07993.1 hypothetical protein MELLADRAFT_85311 [Melampsora larici-populina 98AG31]